MRKKRHILRRLLLLILLAAAAGVAYIYLAPLMRAEEIVSYVEYRVRRGSIATENSFSASISVAASETHQNTSRATSIREIYVENGQVVRKGDKLMTLDNGELLKAGLDGVVTEMRFDTTDWLWNNVNLIQISDLTHLKVSLSVDEYDVRNVAAGQKCIVTIIPLGEAFETEITHVDRVSASSGQVAYYTASAELTVPEYVLPGMTASVTIPSDSVEDVLVLDLAALAFDEDKQPYVLRKEGESYQRIPVTTGLTDGMQVEILSGLSEGETVWAVSGTEAAESPYTLTEIYKQLVGEKIVINDMTGGSDRNSRPSFEGMPMRNENQGMPAMDGPDTERRPGNMPQGMMTPDDADGQTERQGAPVFDADGPERTPAASQQPADTDKEAADISEEESAATEAPTRREMERKETP